jgi:hypothetical protein
MAHPDVRRSNTAELLQLKKPIKSVQLFPADVVVMAVGEGNEAEILRFVPAMLGLYKFLWDRVNDTDKKLLRKHLKRCIYIRGQFKQKLGLEEYRRWYMSVILSAAELE